MASKYMQKFPIPDQFPDLLHDFTREILHYQPQDIIAFGAKYFEALLNNEDPSQIQDLAKTEYAQRKIQSRSSDKEQTKPQQIVKQNTPKQIQQKQEKMEQKQQSKEISRKQSNQSGKPATPKIEQEDQQRPESGQSRATSHKTEKQVSQVYMSKLYSDIAQNTSEQKSKSIVKDDSVKNNYPCGTLWVVIHQFQKSEKFNEAEKVYILGFPTTNSQSIYKTQEVESKDLFQFETECHFYFDTNNAEDIEFDEPSIVFQAYKIDSVKEQLGQAIIPMNLFINKKIQNQEFQLFDQQGQETQSSIKISLNFKVENLDQSQEVSEIQKQSEEQVEQQQQEYQDQEEQLDQTENNQLISDEILKEAFDQFDIDGSGFIEKNELAIFLNNLQKDAGAPEYPQEFIDEAMNAIDFNDDGKVSFLEFKKFIQICLSEK